MSGHMHVGEKFTCVYCKETNCAFCCPWPSHAYVAIIGDWFICPNCFKEMPKHIHQGMKAICKRCKSLYCRSCAGSKEISLLIVMAQDFVCVKCIQEVKASLQ